MPELKKFYIKGYGSEAGTEQNGTLVTHECLRHVASTPSPFINLIKILRAVSGMGLKDAKDGIENNCVDGRNLDRQEWGTINPDKVEAYFKQFIGPFPTAEELKAEQEASTGKTMFEGCALAFANYKILGYPNKFAAARDVINRYEDKHDDKIR
jgi:hypothetical protein